MWYTVAYAASGSSTAALKHTATNLLSGLQATALTRPTLSPVLRNVSAPEAPTPLSISLIATRDPTTYAALWSPSEHMLSRTLSGQDPKACTTSIGGGQPAAAVAGTLRVPLLPRAPVPFVTPDLSPIVSTMLFNLACYVKGEDDTRPAAGRYAPNSKRCDALQQQHARL